MTTQKMLRANELPFEVPEHLAQDIEAYIDAYERCDWQLDMYMEILYQSAGALSEHDRRWLIEYYTNSGWATGLEYDDVA